MSVAERLEAMPGWPILMNALTGALYLEISTSSFHALVRRRGVRPVDMGLGVVRWRREDLDRLVEALPRRGPSSEEAPRLADFDAALEQCARRAAQGRHKRAGP